MHQARIMLVEDEKVVAADIEECVKSLGYQVVGSAATGTDALRLAVKTMPDLVLMDIKLKGILDGIDVASALYDQLKIPVVYLTAHADSEVLERARLTAPSGYVLKPFDDRTLRTAIELAFDRHRRERRLVESGQRLAAAIGNIDEAVIVAQESGEVALMNRVAESLTGWNQADALGRPIDEVFALLNGCTGSPRPSPVGRVFREGVAIGLGEDALLLSRDGTREPIQGSITPVRDGGDETVGACVLFRAANMHSAVEPWGSLEHGSAGRLEILGRVTGAVAQKFTSLLEGGRGRAHAARLAGRLLDFSRRHPAAPVVLDLNGFIAGMDDLLECALGEQVALELTLMPVSCRAKADPAGFEQILMYLALAARDTGVPGTLTIETSAVTSQETGDGYTIVTVTSPGPSRDLPALDEIVSRCPGEVRIAMENRSIKIYQPLEAGL